MTDIIETAELDEEDGFREDMAATTESQPKERLEFHVQMRGYTLREMDALIVEAAARLIVGKHGDHKLAKDIQDRCVELTTAKADAKLDTITTEILDAPMLATFPGQTTKTPVTMREYLGLLGRDYLSAKVGHNGEPTDSNWGSFGTRMQYLVARAMDVKFKQEIEKATNAAIAEVQAAVRAEHKALIDAETARIREAIQKVTGPAQ